MNFDNIIVSIKPIPFGYRFLTNFLPTFIICLFIVCAVGYFRVGSNIIDYEVLILIIVVLVIRGIRWSKNYITEIKISRNIVEVTVIEYGKNQTYCFPVDEIRAKVSKALPKGGGNQLFISQRVKKENILQYEMGEWTADRMKYVAQVLTDPGSTKK